MHTLAIIDKQPILRLGIRLFLEAKSKDFTILTADNMQHFTPMQPDHKPDLFIIGTGIGLKTDNFELIKSIRKQFSDAAILLYDQKPDPALLPLYLKNGIKGYMSKQNDLEELHTCIWQVLAGKKYICRQIQDMNINLALKSRKNSSALSSREYEVASYLSQGMKMTWIAHTLGIKISTASTLKNKIFAKMKVENILQLREAMFIDYSF
jgi:DNA-binding NarL/FixJ family response regulator